MPTIHKRDWIADDIAVIPLGNFAIPVHILEANGSDIGLCVLRVFVEFFLVLVDPFPY